MRAARIHSDAVVVIEGDGAARLASFPLQDALLQAKRNMEHAQETSQRTGRLMIENRLWKRVKQVRPSSISFEWRSSPPKVPVWFRSDQHLVRCYAERIETDRQAEAIDSREECEGASSASCKRGRPKWHWCMETLESIQVEANEKLVDVKASPFAPKCEAALTESGHLLLNPLCARHQPKQSSGVAVLNVGVNGHNQDCNIHDWLAADCRFVSFKESERDGSGCASALAYANHPSCYTIALKNALVSVDLRCGNPIQARHDTRAVGPLKFLEKLHSPPYGLLSIHHEKAVLWDSRLNDRYVACVDLELASKAGPVGVDAVGDTVAIWSELPGDISALRIGSGQGDWQFTNHVEGLSKRQKESALQSNALRVVNNMRAASNAINLDDDSQLLAAPSIPSTKSASGNGLSMPSSDASTSNGISGRFSNTGSGASVQGHSARNAAERTKNLEGFLRFLRPTPRLLQRIYVRAPNVGGGVMTVSPAAGGFLANDATKLFVTNVLGTWSDFHLS